MARFEKLNSISEKTKKLEEIRKKGERHDELVEKIKQIKKNLAFLMMRRKKPRERKGERSNQ